MRRPIENSGLTVNAIAGNHAVFFGFDLSDEARDGCLGIALHREDLTDQTSRWLSGFKTFRSQVPAPALTAIHQTEAQPIQAAASALGHRVTRQAASPDRDWQADAYPSSRKGVVENAGHH